MWFFIQSKTTVVAMWFVLVCPWHGSEVHGSLNIQTSSLNTTDRAGCAFSVEFILPFKALCSSPHTLLSLMAQFGEGGLTQATKNLQHSVFLPQVGLSSEEKLGPAPILTPPQSQTHVREARAHSYAPLKELPPFDHMRIYHSYMLLIASCQGSQGVFIFMDAHSVTYPCLFMHLVKITQGYLGSTNLINPSITVSKVDTITKQTNYKCYGCMHMNTVLYV